VTELTRKDLKQIRGDWYTVAVVTIDQHLSSKYKSPRSDGKVLDALYFDLSTSKIDKRDWIISRRSDIYLQQDTGFISSWSKRGWTKDELFEELLNLANEAVQRCEAAHV
jgi:hypothetical protein